MVEQQLLLLGDGLRRVDGALIVWIFDHCCLVGVLEGAHRISLFTRDRDDAAAPWHLEDIVAVVGCFHKLGQCWIPKDGVVRQTDVGNIKVDELGAVVVMGTEGDREADLPYRDGGAAGHS